MTRVSEMLDALQSTQIRLAPVPLRDQEGVTLVFASRDDIDFDRFAKTLRPTWRVWVTDETGAHFKDRESSWRDIDPDGDNTVRLSEAAFNEVLHRLR